MFARALCSPTVIGLPTRSSDSTPTAERGGAVSSDRTTLGDFGGGWDRPDVDGEDDVKLRLTEWFEAQGCDVYWDESKPYGRPTFTPDVGGSEIADLLVAGEWDAYVLEVKDARKGGSWVIDGALDQLLQKYWANWVSRTGEEKYRTQDGETFQPDAFLVGTQFAADGSLFERNSDEIRHTAMRDRIQRVDCTPWCPDWEYYRTETITRVLWRRAKEMVQGRDAPGIGIVVSDRLDSHKRPVHIPPEAVAPLTPGASGSHRPMAFYRTFGGSGNPEEWRAIE